MTNAVPTTLAIGLLLNVATARAAGGHFDVDDASVLDPGHCQYETWLARAPDAAATLFHLGPGCRVGPVEIGVNLDWLSGADGRLTNLGPQLKWVVDPWVGKLSTGLAWSASFDVTHGGRPAHTAYVPLTWWAAEKLWVHANVGADWEPSRVRTRRVGVSGEWAATDRWTVIGERGKFLGNWTSRLGVRFNLNESIGLDLSAARTGPGATRLFVIGLNHDFAR